MSPHFKCEEDVQNVPLLLLFRQTSRIKVIEWRFEQWDAGISHLLFPLISLENLVKIERYNNELVSLPAAQIAHCFHSCLARRTRLKVGGRFVELVVCVGG